MNDIKKIEGELFKFDHGLDCGLLMKKEIKDKIVELQNDFIKKMKETLREHKADLIAYAWTMAWEDGYKGNGVFANYIDKSTTVDDRILLLCTPDISKKTECYNTTNRSAVKKKIQREYNIQLIEELQKKIEENADLDFS